MDFSRPLCSKNGWFWGQPQQYLCLSLEWANDTYRMNSRVTQQCNMPLFLSSLLAEQPLSPAFLLAWKSNWLARTCIMNMRKATRVETQLPRFRLEWPFCLFSILCKWYKIGKFHVLLQTQSYVNSSIETIHAPQSLFMPTRSKTLFLIKKSSKFSWLFFSKYLCSPGHLQLVLIQYNNRPSP